MRCDVTWVGARPVRLRVADWAGLSSGRSDWVASDGLHLNGTGAMAMARLVADALDGLTPTGCDQGAGGTLPSGASSGRRESETTKVRLLRSPVRVIDTRATADGAVRAGHVLRVPLSGAGVPTGAPGVLATVTVTDPCEPGFVSAFAPPDDRRCRLARALTVRTAPRR